MKRKAAESQRNMGTTHTGLSRALALIGILLVLCLFATACGTKTVRALAEGEVAIASFSEERAAKLVVPLGTAAEEIGLPDTLSASVVIPQEPSQDAEQSEAPTEMLELRDVPVTWVSEDYTPDSIGTYLFLAVLQPGYVYEGTLPTIEVEVQAAEGAEPSATPDPSETPEPSVTPDASASPEVTPTPDPTLDFVITSFVNEPIEIFVERGTSEENIPLPATLTAINGNGVQIEVPVTWASVADEANELYENETIYAIESRYGYGPWVFTASILNPSSETVETTEQVEESPSPDQTEEPVQTPEVSTPSTIYTYTGEPVTASVRIVDCNEIQSFCGISEDGLLMRFVIFEGGSVHLPDQTGAFMQDGGYRNIPISWSGSYDTNSEGSYTLHMRIEDGYSGGGRATAEIVVLKAASKSDALSGEESDGYSVQIIE